MSDRPLPSSTPPSVPDIGSVAALGRAGFATRADVYRRSRPGYPPALFDHLVAEAGLGAGSVVVDLAAGAGALAGALRDHRANLRVLAVEPSAAMRGQCALAVPGLAVVGGGAEALPLAGGAARAVVVGQAFHWFDAGRALGEIDRVLGPAGTVMLVWNHRDESVPWVAELGWLLHQEGRHAHPPLDHFGAIVADDRRFTAWRRWSVPFVTPIDVPTLVDLAASRSYVNVLADDQRRDLLDRVRALGESVPGPLELAYETIAFTARRRGGAT